jgi:hypothetical protein
LASAQSKTSLGSLPKTPAEIQSYTSGYSPQPTPTNTENPKWSTPSTPQCVDLALRTKGFTPAQIHGLSAEELSTVAEDLEEDALDRELAETLGDLAKSNHLVAISIKTVAAGNQSMHDTALKMHSARKERNSSIRRLKTSTGSKSSAYKVSNEDTQVQLNRIQLFAESPVPNGGGLPPAFDDPEGIDPDL